MKITVWTCGGGTQSAGIAGLIAQKRLPAPDLAVMADTEREKSTTWRYVEEVIWPNLPCPLVILKKSEWDAPDLVAKNGLDLLIPAYTRQSGTLGKLPTFCSNEWKQRVVRRYLRSIGVTSCRMWFGISKDEAHRMKPSGVAWITNEFPLIDLGFGRQDCVDIVRGMGWPDPPKSSCWLCPNQRNEQWQEVRRTSDWPLAVAADREIRQNDPSVYLHFSGVPLDQADLTVPDKLQGDLFGDECMGMCGV